ncbi:MAG: hypothetical protein ABIH42_10555 [Planctomycetota bacterium]
MPNSIFLSCSMLKMNFEGKNAHRIYIQALRKMSPEAKLMKAFELSQFSKDLFMCGLRKRFPGLTEEEIHKIYLKRLEKCHNRNY